MGMAFGLDVTEEKLHVENVEAMRAELEKERSARRKDRIDISVSRKGRGWGTSRPTAGGNERA